jgi:hypothetical protein
METDCVRFPEVGAEICMYLYEHWSPIGFFPVSIIPPLLHTNIYLHTDLIRRAIGRGSEPIK